MTDTAHNKLPIWAYIPDDKDGLEIHSAACNPAAWCDLEKCREISATLFTGEQFHLIVDFWNSSYLINNIQVTIFRHVNFVSGQRFKGKYLVRISAIIDEKHKWFNVWFSNAVDAVHTVNVIRKSIYIKGYSPDTFRPRWTGTLQIKVYINSSKRHISEKRYEVFLNKEGLFLFNDWFTEEVAAFSVIHDLNQSVCMSKTEGLNVFEINTTEYVLTVFEKELWDFDSFNNTIIDLVDTSPLKLLDGWL